MRNGIESKSSYLCAEGTTPESTCGWEIRECAGDQLLTHLEYWLCISPAPEGNPACLRWRWRGGGGSPPSWAFLGPESEFQMGTADPAALTSLSLSLPSPCHSSLFHPDPLVLEWTLRNRLLDFLRDLVNGFPFLLQSTCSCLGWGGAELCRGESLMVHEGFWSLGLLLDSGTSEAQQTGPAQRTGGRQHMPRHCRRQTLPAMCWKCDNGPQLASVRYFPC